MSAGIILPPARYTQPFAGRIIYESMPYWKIQDRIGSPRVKGRVEGLSWLFPDPQNPGKMAGHVILPERNDDEGITQDLIEEIKKHEVWGHLNGWSQDHEDGVF